MNAVAGAAESGSGTEEHQRVAPYLRRGTADRDEAESIISELYLPNRLDLSGSAAPLDVKVSGLRLGALTAGRLTYGRRVHLRTDDAQCFHVNIPLRGRAASRSGNSERVTTGPGEGLVFSPGAPAQISWSADCELLCLMIPRPRLEAELEQLLGRSLRGPLSFDFTADLGAPLGKRWKSVLGLLVDELDHPTALGSDPLMGRHLEALVLDGLLLSQPHSHTDLASARRHVAMSATVKRAVELIEELPGEPWTTVRLAAEVHLSVRALQEGFKRDLGMPPMTYLRQTRLRRARDALQAADRGSTTVSAVASSQGILHMSRFAAAYREAFGETPSDTLSRAAGRPTFGDQRAVRAEENGVRR